MFHGLGDLEPNQVLIVSLGAFLLLSAAMACALLVLLYGSDRADGKRQPTSSSRELPQGLSLSGWIVGALYLIGGLVYLRFLFVVLATMQAAHIDPQSVTRVFWYRAVGAVLVGVIAIVAVFVLSLWISDKQYATQIEVFALPVAYVFRESSWLKGVLKKLSDAQPAGRVKASGLISPWKKLRLSLVRILGPGYGRFDENGDPVDLNPGHGFAGILAAICLALYFIAGGGHRRLYTDAPFEPVHAYDAVLLHVILLLLLACWLLSGLSFYFDRFRNFAMNKRIAYLALRLSRIQIWAGFAVFGFVVLRWKKRSGSNTTMVL
jgi:hypothetical protein